MSSSLGRGTLCSPYTTRQAKFSESTRGKNPKVFTQTQPSRIAVRDTAVRAATLQAETKPASEGHTALLHGLGSVGDIAPSHMPWLLRLAHTRYPRPCCILTASLHKGCYRLCYSIPCSVASCRICQCCMVTWDHSSSTKWMGIL